MTQPNIRSLGRDVYAPSANESEQAATLHLLRGSLSRCHVRTVASNWSAWDGFADRHGLDAENPTDEQLVAFIEARARAGASWSTLNASDPTSRRRFILVTNDENSIYTKVTQPRLKAAITGKWGAASGVPDSEEICKRSWRSSSGSGADISVMTVDPNQHSHDIADLPPVDQVEASQALEAEAATYIEVGEFYFRNPIDLGTRVLVNWFTEVSQSSPARRWGTLEMLALYGLTAAEATGGLPLTEQECSDLVAAVSVDGPFRADVERAAEDALGLLQSGADPVLELPGEWALYRHVLPAAFTAACLVFAVLTLETVRQFAVTDGADPAVLWKEWLTSSAGM